ncbi:hypothetical protein [Leifsonia sp. TF02-11]|uniref:hypothetical protein n=1 Tax=Leifsonia sp. TF02-11 TaxID=2815212 RepID=UPI001AA15C0E|nr:hypothetical protein [Leifsonia sp. TF02-11]MBO1738972.1 hypothetical protein [Leifsonia sp. TF02-11]
MAKNLRRGIIGTAVVALLAAGFTVTSAGAASAITRMGCVSHTLNLVSSSTTCWGNAGYASVTLNGVYSIISGNNAGYVQGSKSLFVSFPKYVSASIATQTISGIKID